MSDAFSGGVFQWWIHNSYGVRGVQLVNDRSALELSVASGLSRAARPRSAGVRAAPG